MIHDALVKSAQNSCSLKYRLDILKNSERTIELMSSKARELGSSVDENFVKDFLDVQKFDFDIYELG